MPMPQFLSIKWSIIVYTMNLQLQASAHYFS